MRRVRGIHTHDVMISIYFMLTVIGRQNTSLFMGNHT